MKTRQKSRRQNETELKQDVKVTDTGVRWVPEEEKQRSRVRTPVCSPGSQGELTPAPSRALEILPGTVTSKARISKTVRL